MTRYIALLDEHGAIVAATLVEPVLAEADLAEADAPTEVELAAEPAPAEGQTVQVVETSDDLMSLAPAEALRRLASSLEQAE